MRVDTKSLDIAVGHAVGYILTRKLSNRHENCETCEFWWLYSFFDPRLTFAGPCFNRPESDRFWLRLARHNRVVQNRPW
jgi:hypothetical protein